MKKYIRVHETKEVIFCPGSSFVVGFENAIPPGAVVYAYDLIGDADGVTDIFKECPIQRGAERTHD
jgi:hypothetical protein